MENKKLYELALEVFNYESEKLIRWMNKYNQSIGSTPNSLLGTEKGEVELIKLLSKIDKNNY